MTERAQNFMDQIWSIRNSNDCMTEEQLLSAVLKLAAEQVTSYNAQNDMIVLDRGDLLQLAEELVN
jgi:homogentisate 1,2-dioxygenase